MNEGSTRAYRMTARADAAAVTGTRILDAVTELFWEKPTDQVVLGEVARRAGVTVQTVLRRFGSREGLIAAAAERAMGDVEAQRRTPVGDLAAAVEGLVEHYERYGAGVLRLLAAEEGNPALADLAERGRRVHRDWCATVFAGALDGLSAADRRRRRAQLVAVCDVYMWKLLRLDAGLGAAQTRLALTELLRPLVTSPEGVP